MKNCQNRICQVAVWSALTSAWGNLAWISSPLFNSWVFCSVSRNFSLYISETVNPAVSWAALQRSTSARMPKISNYIPTIENTELFATFERTSPQVYSSIATSDKFLLRYASNTWNILIPNCVFHPELTAIRVPIPFFNDAYNDPIILDIPFNSVSSLGFIQHSNPYYNTFTLECLCEVYMLAETCIFRLPTTSALRSMYRDISDDGLTFSIPYTEIKENRIIDNLTKLSLYFKDDKSPNTNELIFYPLQRLPPQPLSTGVFQPFSNLTPFQCLQLVHQAIDDGIELSKNMINYFNSVYSPAVSSRSVIEEDVNLVDNELTLSASGCGDDDHYTFDSDKFNEQNTRLESMGAMSVEMIGGFNSSGEKRGRTASDDAINLAAFRTKHKRL